MALSADGMATEIEKEFIARWSSATGQNLSTLGQEQRRILFLGIAQGILKYLEANQNYMFNSITLRTSSHTTRTYPVTELDLNV